MSIWEGKRVLITGHTGFKGSWLTMWLRKRGAILYGIALEPPSEPNLFSIANLHTLMMEDHRLDIRNYEKLYALMHDIQPEIIFHLAAQPLVQYSYDFPLETYTTNIIGTANILEAIRHCNSIRAALIVTSDKCYENKEMSKLYNENDRLGGKDPYSSSKACAEIVTDAYRQGYFSEENCPNIATARAGNVVGGGDWALDRLIPDCVRAYLSKKVLKLRYPDAVRPWQHVLESIHGYVLLAETLLSDTPNSSSGAWNFGPEIEDMQSVGEVAKQACRLLDISCDFSIKKSFRDEASLLRLDSTKAKKNLKWHPRWSLQKSIEETIAWYKAWINGSDMLEFSHQQMKRFLQIEVESITI